MLVLARKTAQKLIIIGPDGLPITLTILDVKGELVKLGLDAPQSVSIYREEIYQDIIEANHNALNAPLPTCVSAYGNLDLLVKGLDQAQLPKKPKEMGLMGIKQEQRSITSEPKP
jgi:carbon storage regulator